MRKMALLVGVEEYRDRDITPLRYVRADVAAFATALQDDCGFDQVHALAAAAGPNAPEPRNILDTLQRLAGHMTADDLFLFYFCGHGIEVKGESYLLMPDSHHSFPALGSLPMRQLQEILATLPARRRVLLLDACRNDPQAGRGDADNLLSDVMSRDIVAVADTQPLGGASISLLTACRPGQRAYEWSQEGHGVFTYYLLDGMKGPAWDGSELEFRRLAGHVSKEVRRWSESMPGLTGVQEPDYQHFGDPDPIVLATRDVLVETPAEDARPPAGSVKILEPAVLCVTTTPPGATVYVDGQPKGTSPLRLPLDPGEHVLRAELDEHSLWQQRIGFDGAGDADLEITLTPLPAPPGQGRTKEPPPVPAETKPQGKTPPPVPPQCREGKPSAAPPLPPTSRQKATEPPAGPADGAKASAPPPPPPLHMGKTGERKAVEPGRPESAVVIEVVFPGMWFAFDIQTEIALDGKTLGTGSVVNGFSFEIESTVGHHILGVKIPLRAAKTYPLSLAKAGRYRVQLDYSRFWGNWAAEVSTFYQGPTGK